MQTQFALTGDPGARVRHARVLVELGCLEDAERALADARQPSPDDEALALLTKIRHMKGELSLALAGWSELHARARRRGEESVRARASGAEAYKRRVIAVAWLAARAGDLLRACTLLEELGKVRPFTADRDRVLALAPLYERIGTRPCLEAAAHIYRFLARDGDDATRVVALGHLVGLYERLGDGERARAAEREHVAAFHASMSRPAPDELPRAPRRVNDQALGRALAASVYAFAGGAREGLIHEIWAGREPVQPGSGGTLADEHIFGNLTPEMHKDVKSTFLAVREYARAKLPHRTAGLMGYRYTYKVTKEDEPSGGASAGLPTALAFLSLFTGEPLPQDLAATGQIVTDAHDVLTVRAVGDVPYKMRAACHRNLRALVAPAANRAELLVSPLVPRAVSLEIGRFAGTFEEAVRHVFGRDLSG